MPAATAHAAIRHDASGLRTARAHVAHLFLRSGGSYGTCFALFVCEANDTDYLVAWPAFGAPLLIRSALSALDASCDCACCDQTSCIGAAGGPNAARLSPCMPGQLSLSPSVPAYLRVNGSTFVRYSVRSLHSLTPYLPWYYLVTLSSGLVLQAPAPAGPAN